MKKPKNEEDISVPTDSFTMRMVDEESLKDKSDDLKERFKEYGKSVLLEFDNNGFAVYISEVNGLSLKMPKKFFDRQLKDVSSEDFEITFTPSETLRIIHMLNYWMIGKDYEKVLKKCGWEFPGKRKVKNKHGGD